MCCEVFVIDWIKLELIGDEYNLQLDLIVLFEVIKILLVDGFKVLFYCIDDLVLCQCFVDLGCEVLMFWGVLIGMGKGLLNFYNLKMICECLLNYMLIVDVGLGLLFYVC